MHTNHHPPTRPGSGIGKGDSGNGRVEAHRICTSSKRSQVTMELCRWIMHGAVARIQTTGMPPPARCTGSGRALLFPHTLYGLGRAERWA